ncbi:hypothetical protein llap_10527 [Limosa lapponica baueri]|uniref:Uncharacterized protein n=1 Tax=Limosa lapponica baueri TaxID=1758121 RepID=A0A2I0TZI0_LIMLA|nr:hypothetical protein llap_10527 [Limosa lapponica baueri]
MQGCVALGTCKTGLAYLMKHMEEMSMRQKGMEDGGEQKGPTRAESAQAWPERKAEGARRNCSGQAVPMAGGDQLGAGYIRVLWSTRTLWVGLDCHRAELEGGHAGWG